MDKFVLFADFDVIGKISEVLVMWVFNSACFPVRPELV